MIHWVWFRRGGQCKISCLWVKSVYLKSFQGCGRNFCVIDVTASLVTPPLAPHTIPFHVPTLPSLPCEQYGHVGGWWCRKRRALTSVGATAGASAGAPQRKHNVGSLGLPSVIWLGASGSSTEPSESSALTTPPHHNPQSNCRLSQNEPHITI